jgi:hypothetical protein
MRANAAPATALFLATVLCMAPAARTAAPQKKEYLSQAEADKIRDGNERSSSCFTRHTWRSSRNCNMNLRTWIRRPNVPTVNFDQRRTGLLTMRLTNRYWDQKQEDIRQG